MAFVTPKRTEYPDSISTTVAAMQQRLAQLSKDTEHPGSIPTVIASFLHYDSCVTIWVILSALSVYISPSFHLNVAQQGLMVAIPTLSGSLFRFPIGLLSDRFSTKWIGVGMLILLFIPLLLGWLIPVNFPALLGVGLMLGVAGASFAVALPIASRWYPPSKQGLVMGIAAAGNIGTVIANLFAPLLASIYGWHAVLGFATIPLAVTLLAFLLMAKDSPTKPKSVPASRYVAALRKADLWRFCLLYSVTSGGCVGLSTFLPQFFHNQYQLNAIDAGYLTAAAAFMGSIVRPLGGYLADKLGGVRTLTVVFAVTFALYTLASLLLPIGFAATLFIIGMAFLGTGSGATLQLVAQCFSTEIGMATGLIGAFGGIGGFLLPILMGYINLSFHSYTTGWVVLADFVFIALIVLRILVIVNSDWRTSWAAKREASNFSSSISWVSFHSGW
jgi:NNP family nitrate/nitrite transporter-like MFS transporter